MISNKLGGRCRRSPDFCIVPTGILFFLLLSVFPALVSANGTVQVTGLVPYSASAQTVVLKPGDAFAFFLSLENTGESSQQAELLVQLPAGIRIGSPKKGWKIIEDGGKAVQTVGLSEGYSAWFDLLTLRLDEQALPGKYAVLLWCNQQRYVYELEVGAATGKADSAIKITDVRLPQDENGEQDLRYETNTVVLRDPQSEALKNYFTGKDAATANSAWMFPLTYAGITIENSRHINRIVMLRGSLRQKETDIPVPGLYVPGVDGEMIHDEDGFQTLIDLNGNDQQTYTIPLYIDERQITQGEYVFHWEIEDEIEQLAEYQMPVYLKQRNDLALISSMFSGLLFAGGSIAWFRRLPLLMKAMKVEYFTIIAMFGVISFVVVNLPSKLLWGISHIVLGPLGILVTGFFSVICMSALTIALLILLPKPGTVTLFITVKFILSTLLFGQISLLSFVVNGITCILLEGLLSIGKFYPHLSRLNAGEMPPLKHMVLLVAGFGLAKMLLAFIDLQAMSLLYRMYYAEWYLWMNAIVNGFVYTVIGTISGIWLGRLLSKLKTD